MPAPSSSSLGEGWPLRSTPRRVGPIVIDTVEPGHVVGLSWMAAPFRWQFDARALEPVEAVAIDARLLKENMAAHPEAAAELHQRLAAVVLARLQSTRIRLLDLYANAGPLIWRSARRPCAAR